MLCLGGETVGTVEEVMELSMEMTCWQVGDIIRQDKRNNKLKLEKMAGVELIALAR